MTKNLNLNFLFLYITTIELYITPVDDKKFKIKFFVRIYNNNKVIYIHGT